MNRILVVYILTFVSYFSGFSQSKINDYKYIIIPMQYEFQKSEDEYQVNSLTKFLFNKYGYTAFFQNEQFPSDLDSNRCLALTADIVNLKGFLTTKLQIELKDCKNNVIATSKIGKSKVKAYEKAYNMAIRDAFSTFQFFNYSYKENPDIQNVNTANLTDKEKEIERLKKEVETLKEHAVEQSTGSEQSSENIIENTQENQKQLAETKTIISEDNQSEILYAQPIRGGYQVVDTEPKKVMVLLLSGAENYFIVQGKDAVVYKKDNVWMYAENDGKNMTVKKIQLKF